MRKTHKFLSGVLGLLYAATTAAAPVCAVDSTPQQTAADKTAVHNDCRMHFPLVTLDDIPNKIQKKHPRGMRLTSAETDPETTGGEAYIPLLLITVGFNDLPYTDDYNVNEWYFSSENSVSAFYHDQSFGRFTFMPAKETAAFGKDGNTNVHDKENDGVVHVHLDMDRPDLSGIQTYDPTDAAAEQAFWEKTESIEYMVYSEALKQADHYVDFAAYDTDGSGSIETYELSIGFVVSGWNSALLLDEEYETAERNKLIWPMSFGFSGMVDLPDFSMDIIPKLDDTLVDLFIAVPEYGKGDKYTDITDMCHELGHFLGLPDLYDTRYLAPGDDNEWLHYDSDYLSLMASGTYQLDPETDEFMPASFDAWSKMMLGWTEPVEVTESGTYEITAADYDDLSKNCKVLRIPTQRENEYYLIENRQAKKWDKGLTYTLLHDIETTQPEALEEFKQPVWKQEGLILWHIDMSDYNKYYDDNTVSVTDHHPCVMPLYGERVNEEEMLYTTLGVRPATRTGFYSKYIWDNRYSETVGNKLNLPVYGVEDPEKRSNRWLSGITMEFLDDSADSMHVTVDLDNYKRVIVHSPYLPPTEFEDGWKEYWYDSVLGEYYSDPEGKNLIEDITTYRINATGEFIGETTTAPSETAEITTTTTASSEQSVPAGETTTAENTDTTDATFETTVPENTDVPEPTETAADATEKQPETTASTAEAATTAASTAAETTTTASAATVPASEMASTTVPAETEPTGFTPEKLCDMALKDFKVKHGISADNAEAVLNADGTVSITITSGSEVKDVYTVDPRTGTGTSRSGAVVDLPKTGNTSHGTAAAAGGAALLAVGGLFAVLKSGAFRRKNND